MPKLLKCSHCGNRVENLTRTLCQRPTCYKDPAVRAAAPVERPVKPWTAAEVLLVRELRRREFTIASIADQLGRSRDSVTQVVVRLLRQHGERPKQIRGWR